MKTFLKYIVAFFQIILYNNTKTFWNKDYLQTPARMPKEYSSFHRECTPKQLMKKLTIATNRISVSQRMVWIPDPPGLLLQKLKQVCFQFTFKVSALSLTFCRMGNVI
jgi:hypothetical protein